LDRGRLYLREAFSAGNIQLAQDGVIARNFHQVGPKQFECDWADLLSFTDARTAASRAFIPVAVEITTSRSLVFHIPRAGPPTTVQPGQIITVANIDGDQMFVRLGGSAVSRA